MSCPICGGEDGGNHPTYPNLVCEECDRRAVNAEGDEPWYGWRPENEPDSEDGVIKVPPDQGENPVYIDGQKCWRRYRFGGWVTMLDKDDCGSIEEFYETHNML